MYVFDEFFLGGSWSVPLVHRDDAEVKFYFLERERRKKRKTVRNSRERFISANLKINSRRRKGRKKRNLVLREKYKRAAAGGRTDGRTDFPGTAAEKKAVRERLYRRENTQQLECNNKTLKNISLSLPFRKKENKR